MHQWCTIESDPVVFEEIIREFGVLNVQAHEIISLEYDPSFYHSLGQVYGFIFLFNWQPLQYIENVPPEAYPDIFFAHQVVENACATQAILSVLLNNLENLELGDYLINFRSFCMNLDPHSRGLSIGNSEFLSSVHNAFGTPTVIDIKKEKHQTIKEAYHFVAYVYKEADVFQLDGLRKGPVKIKCDKHSAHWIEKVLMHVKARIANYRSDEIRFNLIALAQDQKAFLSSQQKLLKARIENSSSTPGINVTNLLDELTTVEALLAQRLETLKAQSIEISRQKHAYIPLIFALLSLSAKDGSLRAATLKAYSKKNSK